MVALRSKRLFYQTAAFFSIAVIVLIALRTTMVKESIVRLTHGDEKKEPSKPTYKPKPDYLPPPIIDPFPLLASGAELPPIPSYNVPEKDVWKTKFNLTTAPPLLIGFTRTWPMLLQTVVSYITAGWPPEQIYVVENTGTQQANTRGQLTLQHPFYLNHTSLKKLGVNIIQTPVLLTFAQLQNFYLSLSYTHNWPWYFWSHMDVLAMSYEDGFENFTPPAGQPGYKSLYTLCLEELKRTIEEDDKWAVRLFAYDHLTLQNPRAVEAIGGWDQLIPYYMTDCDTYSRWYMTEWSQKDAKAGVITDTSVALDNLLALYRDPTVTPKFTDPNPPPSKRDEEKAKEEEVPAEIKDSVEYWRRLLKIADSMFHYKHGNRGRNTWQAGQHGGQGEPFYYDNAGFTEALEVLTEAGREVYRRKWGHRDCDLLTGAGLQFDDQWRVLPDWPKE